MTHTKPLSRTPSLAQAPLAPLEQLIILVLTAFFSDYQNFPQVIQNLQKFYSKTP